MVTPVELVGRLNDQKYVVQYKIMELLTFNPSPTNPTLTLISCYPGTKCSVWEGRKVGSFPES